MNIFNGGATGMPWNYEIYFIQEVINLCVLAFVLETMVFHGMLFIFSTAEN